VYYQFNSLFSAQFLLCKYIKENTNTVVILSGEGADEVAQGYFHFHKAPSGKEADEASRRHCSNLHYLDVLRTDRTSSAWG
jgi:asparagine synthase (glutamine-hydrolysing)